MSFFNTDFAASRRRRLDQYQQAIQNILAKRTGAENTFVTKTGMLGSEKKRDLRGVLNNFAGRGMAFSTGYAGKNQEVETDYARRHSEAESERNAALAAAGQEEAEENSRFQYDLSDIASQQAQYEAEQQRALVASMAENQPAAPDPATPGTGQIAQARQALTKKQWLAAHPYLASVINNPKARDKFLANHPQIRAEYLRYNF